MSMHIATNVETFLTRMWVDAQHDGRPSEYRMVPSIKVP